MVAKFDVVLGIVVDPQRIPDHPGDGRAITRGNRLLQPPEEGEHRAIRDAGIEEALRPGEPRGHREQTRERATSPVRL